MRKHIKNNVSWVGKIDWELQEFHGSDYTINNGSSQNAYLIEEEKTVLIDTVWKPHSSEFIDNLESEIDLNTIDFIVCNHGEVDHSGSLPALMEKIPNTPIYCTVLSPWLDNIITLNGILKLLKQGTPQILGMVNPWCLWKCACSTGLIPWRRT